MSASFHVIYEMLLIIKEKDTNLNNSNRLHSLHSFCSSNLMLCFIPSFGYIHVYRSKSRLSLIVRVNVVLNRTVVVDNNRTVVVPLSLSFAFDYGEMSSPKRLGLIALLFILLKLLLLLLSVYYYYDYHYYYYLSINIRHVKVWL